MGRRVDHGERAFARRVFPRRAAHPPKKSYSPMIWQPICARMSAMPGRSIAAGGHSNIDWPMNLCSFVSDG